MKFRLLIVDEIEEKQAGESTKESFKTFTEH